MCDCTSESDSELKTQVRQGPIGKDDLQPDKIDSCNCTTEDDSEPANRIPSDENAKAKSCDCTSEGDSDTGTKNSCDCTSEESSDERKIETDENRDNLNKSPFALVQVELSKSMLNLLSSTDSSTSASCDCTTPNSDSQDLPSCPRSKEEHEPSCDCTSESSSESSGATSTSTEKRLEWTLAIIKPEALMFRGEIERIVEEEEGFGICQRRLLQLTAEQVSEFYCDNYEQKDFARLVAYMSSKPIAVYVLCKLDAIAEWRMLIGPCKVSEAKLIAPDSIRGRYGTCGDDMQNAVHGSCDEVAAEREIHFFFPDCILEPLLRDEAAEEYLQKEMMEVLTEGLVKCCEEKPVDPLLWLGNWLLDNNATRPKYLLRSTSNLND